MKTKVDLRALAVDRDGSSAAEPSRTRHRRVLTRFVLPAALLVGFGALGAYAIRDTLSPPRPVTVVPVLSAGSELLQAVDTPMFRAAGWVEPRPTPIVVTALAEGVVETVLVVEGQEVKEGQVVARLVAADAKLALDVAQADVALRESELAGAKAAQVAAQSRLDQPTHLQAELADADAALARVETELSNLTFQLQSAQARQRQARAEWESKQQTASVTPALVLAKAKSDFEAANAVVEELQSRQQRLPVEVTALKQKRDAVRQKLQSKVDETRQAVETAAAVKTAEARVTIAKTARDAAQLRLDRMEVRAPLSGRVLALAARPGMRMTGLNPGSLYDSSTVLTLFDPGMLQVRVDVRLDDVSKVLPSQKVRIETAAVPGKTLDGEVLMATSQADVQKNTLSVKVAIANAPASLRPDMLCQVTFLAPPSPAGQTPASESRRLLIPRQLVESSADGTRVWVADRLTGTARHRRVELGGQLGDLVVVTSGLAASDKLIAGGREGLRDGDRVAVTGEDETLGVR